MYAKRKFSRDDEDNDNFASTYDPSYETGRVKQVKLELTITDNDVAMSDVQDLVNAVPFPSYFPNSPSSDLTDSPNYSLASLPLASPVSYPEFELYPELRVGMDVDFTPRTHQSSHDVASGLLQPSNAGALQHGEHCTQIPRLRLASHPGLNGTRTMWSHCQSCGAIEMVKS